LTAAGGGFEFYGSERQLRRLHARFVRFLDDGPRDLPILDLGCGTGVFLELLRERGRCARGVEIAPEAIAECRRKGLDVTQADVLEFLLAQAEGSYAGTYCSHVIEHCDYDRACRLLEAAHRALATRARMIVVTPNPASLAVISEIFWLDPTHVRPYPRLLLERMMARAGFEVVAAGQVDTPGLPRRQLLRRLWLRLMLGSHYRGMNAFVVGAKTPGP